MTTAVQLICNQIVLGSIPTVSTKKNKNNYEKAGRINVTEEYKRFCDENKIEFKVEQSIKSYDETTLFCPSGMQQFKSYFKDKNCKGTKSNIQSCLRLNDIEEIGDGTHLLYFNMIGLFSFRDWSVEKSIDYWMKFLDRIGIKPDYVTIHPDKLDWKNWYQKYEVEVRLDNECTWSDGEISGYCTEFYKNDIEIGNIVNPLGDCIDVGFGLERLEMILTGKPKSKEETLKETIQKMILSGFKPGNNKQDYILRKLLRICQKENIIIDHPFYEDEVKRQQKLLQKWNQLKDKHKDKSKEWWWDTHGIDLDLM